MRPIKFRAMNETGNWVYFSIWNINPSIIKEKFKNLCEFTGLHDKNGKEIFEDDLVRMTRVGRIYKVGFRDGSFVRILNENKQADLTDEFEVIGNIYENPELMKGEK